MHEREFTQALQRKTKRELVGIIKDFMPREYKRNSEARLMRLTKSQIVKRIVDQLPPEQRVIALSADFSQTPNLREPASEQLASVKGTVPHSPWTRMERYTRMQAITGVVGTLIASIVAILIMIQLQKLQDSLRHDARSRVYSLSQDSTKVFVEFPQLRRHFYSNTPNRLQADNPTKYARLISFTELMADFFEQAFQQRDLLFPGDWNSWWNYFVDTWDTSPILVAFFNDHHDWYSVDDALRPQNLDGNPVWIATDKRDEGKTQRHRAEFHKDGPNRRW